MKKLLPIFLSLALPACAQMQPQVFPSQTAQQVRVTQNLIVYFNPEETTASALIAQATSKWQAKLLYEYQNFNAIALHFPNAEMLAKAKAGLAIRKGVLQVVEDQIQQLQ